MTNLTATVSIRAATPADIPRLAFLRYEFRRVRAPANETELEFRARCEAWMHARLGNDQWRCWVAEHDGVIVGNVWVSLMEKMPNPVVEPEEHAYVTNFFVLDEARGQGVGSLMLGAALAWCEARGVQAAILWPTERGRPLYERHGFSAKGEVMQKRFTR